MKKRGIGMACMYFGMGNTGKPNPSSAFVEVLEDGTCVVMCGAADIGQGSNTTLSIIAAEELGVRVEDVVITTADTQVTPEAGVSSASRQTYVSGNAVKAAAYQAKQILLKEAASVEHLGEPPENLRAAGGYIYAADEPEKRVSIAEIAASCRAKGQLVVGSGYFSPAYKPLDEETGAGIPYATYSYGTQIVEVEVDTETGEVEILRVIAAHDPGRAINPQGVEGQIEGGCAMGVGFALMEEVVVENGVIQTPSFAEYLIPTALDVPPIEPIIVEALEPTGPYGAKGIGEPATVPTAAVINAIYNATGVRIKELPLVPEKVFFALRQGRA